MAEPFSPPAGCQLRPASLDDLAAVYRVRSACGLADYGEILQTEEQLRTRWHAPGFDLAHDAWVATDPAGQLIAYAEADHAGAQAWLAVFVPSKQRGRGLGLALLRHSFAAFYRRGLREVRLSVDDRSRINAARS